MVRKHACVDSPELDAHIIDWDKFLPGLLQFKKQVEESKVRHGLAWGNSTIPDDRTVAQAGRTMII